MRGLRVCLRAPGGLTRHCSARRRRKRGRAAGRGGDCGRAGAAGAAGAIPEVAGPCIPALEKSCRRLRWRRVWEGPTTVCLPGSVLRSLYTLCAANVPQEHSTIGPCKLHEAAQAAHHHCMCMSLIPQQCVPVPRSAASHQQGQCRAGRRQPLAAGMRQANMKRQELHACTATLHNHQASMPDASSGGAALGGVEHRRRGTLAAVSGSGQDVRHVLPGFRR